MKKNEGYHRPDYPPTRSPLKVIRWFCVDCMGGNARAVGLCEDRGCASWPFRFGMSPATAIKHGKDVAR